MFNLAQIDDLHAQLGHANSLAEYMRALAALGVVRFDSFVTDGHSEYFAADGRSVTSLAHHEVTAVAERSDRGSFLEHLRRHSDSETSYVEMSKGLAESGVEKWVADTAELTMTYLDRAGEPLLVEPVE